MGTQMTIRIFEHHLKGQWAHQVIKTKPVLCSVVTHVDPIEDLW